MGLKVVEIATAYPPVVLTNDQLEAEFLSYDPEGSQEFHRIVDKTKIFARHVAPPEITALDLAVQAASRLRDKVPDEFSQIDYVIHCTQSPDYFLPTTACLLHSRLNLPEDVGAIDVNLGCSGFVYCLSLADAMLTAGHATKVLITTADTYTHYIHPRDISNRIIFGDAAAATLVTSDDATPPARFLHWTDGASAQHLIVQNGAARHPRCLSSEINHEAFVPPDASCLYMNGFEVFKFAITKVPAIVNRYLKKHNVTLADYDAFVPHQANAYMLDELNKRIKFPADQVVKYFETVGNTVSASIPIAIEAYLRQGRLRRGSRLLLAGFGVGFSTAIGEMGL